MQKGVLKYFAINKFLLLLLIVGTAAWSITMVKSGLIYDFGMGFWGANGHDGVWHIALAKSLSRGSWEMPTFAGASLQNYHLGFDLLLSGMHFITRIPIENLYFQIFPPILAFLTGLLTYHFVYKWRKVRSEALWSTFFVYFGSSFGWLVTFFRDGVFSGESMFWSQQAVSTLINPPFALSLVIMLLGLILLLKIVRSQSAFYILLTALTFGILIQIKAYAGILALGGLMAAGAFYYLITRKLILLVLAVLATLISLLIFVPFNKNTGGLLVWQPFWFLERMMLLTDRVGWVRYGEAMLNYKSGNVWWKAIPAYTIAFLIFWFGNLGTRVAKEFYILKKFTKWKSVDYIDVFIFSIILAGIFIPTFFLQKGTPWNTIQFLYYSLFFSSITAGIAMANILNRFSSQGKYILAAATIFFTLPTTLSTLVRDYLPGRPPSYISTAELEALKFLANKPQGVVLTYPFDEIKARDLANSAPNRPLYRYVSTAYVSAFADKSVYLEDEINADITGFDWRVRRQTVEQFLESLNQDEVRKFLKENDITYIYWLHGQRARLGETQLGIERIFENSEVDIYKVIKN